MRALEDDNVGNYDDLIRTDDNFDDLGWVIEAMKRIF